MAKDDYYVIVYQVLSYLYQTLKKGEDVDPDELKPGKLFDINEKYWLYIFENMQEEGLIKGFEFREYIGHQNYISLQNVQITPAGIGYLSENRFIAKAERFFKSMKEITPFV